MQLSVSGGSLYIWHLQQNVLGEQKSLEQHNIATALYYDVDNIEQKFNTSMHGVLLFMNNDTNELSDPNFIYLRTLDILVLIGYITFLARTLLDLIAIRLHIYMVFIKTRLKLIIMCNL